jgi:hypothetical protein
VEKSVIELYSTLLGTTKKPSSDRGAFFRISWVISPSVNVTGIGHGLPGAFERFFAQLVGRFTKGLAVARFQSGQGCLQRRANLVESRSVA